MCEHKKFSKVAVSVLEFGRLEHDLIRGGWVHGVLLYYYQDSSQIMYTEQVCAVLWIWIQEGKLGKKQKNEWKW